MSDIEKMIAPVELSVRLLAERIGPVTYQIVLIAEVAPLLWASLYLGRRWTQRRLPSTLRWAPVGYAGVVFFAYAHLLISYAIAPNYIRYEEPFVHCLALLFARGDALYPGLNDAARYGGPYGPMLYIVNALVVSIAGSGQHILKVFNALLLAGGAIALFAAVRKTAGTLLAVAAAALLCAILGDTPDFPVSIRGDGLLVLRRHPGISMQMGYGGQDPETEEAYTLSYYRPILVARGFPYTIDSVSIETSNASDERHIAS